MAKLWWKLGRGVLYYAWVRIAADVWASNRSPAVLVIGALGMLTLALWFLTDIRQLWQLVFGSPTPQPNPWDGVNYYPAYNSDGSLKSQNPNGR